MNKWKKQLNLLIIAVICAVLIIVFFKFDVSVIKQMILDRPELTYPVLFFLFFISSYILLPITPLTILTVSLVDFKEAYILIACSAILGSIGPYFLANKIGKKMIEKELESNGIKFHKLDNFLTYYGTFAVIFARMVPILPYSIWNYIFGLSSIKFWQYFLGTVIGMLIIEFIIIYIISGFISLTLNNILISLAILAILVYFIRDIKKKFELHHK